MTTSEVALLGSVTGLTMGIVIGLFQVVVRMLDRKNGKTPAACLLPDTDRNAIYAIKHLVEDLMNAAGDFKSSHKDLQKMFYEIVRHLDKLAISIENQTKKQTETLEALNTHFTDFRCLQKDINATK